jgi:hypothetical protein
MWSFVRIGQELKHLACSQHRPIRCQLTSLICAEIASCRTWPRQCHKAICEVLSKSVKNWRSYRIHNIDQSHAGASTNQMPAHLINMCENCWLSNLTETNVTTRSYVKFRPNRSRIIAITMLPWRTDAHTYVRTQPKTISPRLRLRRRRGINMPIMNISIKP